MTQIHQFILLKKVARCCLINELNLKGYFILKEKENLFIIILSPFLTLFKINQVNNEQTNTGFVFLIIIEICLICI